MNQIHNIKLSTLTPVSVGDGGQLMPFTDYVLDDEKIVYIDQHKMEARLAESSISLKTNRSWILHWMPSRSTGAYPLTAFAM